MVERKTDNLEAIGSSPIVPNNRSASQRLFGCAKELPCLRPSAKRWGLAKPNCIAEPSALQRSRGQQLFVPARFYASPQAAEEFGFTAKRFWLRQSEAQGFAKSNQ